MSYMDILHIECLFYYWGHSFCFWSCMSDPTGKLRPTIRIGLSLSFACMGLSLSFARIGLSLSFTHTGLSLSFARIGLSLSFAHIGLSLIQHCVRILQAHTHVTIWCATMHDNKTHVAYDCTLHTKWQLCCQQYIKNKFG